MQAGGEYLARDDVGNLKGGGDAELSEQGELDGEGGGEADSQAGQASQQEEAGQGGPPAVALYRRVLQQDGGQLHQAGERGAGVKVGAEAACCQGETVVGGTAGEPAAGEAGGEGEEAGLQERG